MMVTSNYMPFAYFKNQFLPEEECHVSIHDRSFRFGDGIFDTMLVYNGEIYDFISHIERVKNGLRTYKIDLDLSDAENICRELIKQNNVQHGFVRLIFSRGENSGHAVGYTPKDTAPYLLVQASSRPYPAFSPIKLWLSSYKAVLSLPSKSNNAMLYTMALMEASEHHCDNALLLNKDGYVCETASGNIFWLKDNILYTPSLDLEIIPGTIRAKIIELWNGDVQQGAFKFAALQNADEVFMTNIGSLLVPVTTILPASKDWTVGRNTQSLRKALDSDIITSCAVKITGK